ncbi:hypothetical protein I3843_16G063800 [Carya illinoinensis]|uniref:C2H2-type domain-containing protein n=1 Tax=Carya illinoinensis TaxID=32201 RepID=A0A8T1N278_CARIL|nr:zinc finger protein JAGGED-like isoform X2 [Carya illinoinensis]KAG2664129.1 hypothetical protein I3760_16G065100 [Carya illinoinensis]KAG6624996.1 hypothetical protein CIPAW_16G065300 [Carya illinoinensis]KAG6624997.1 hypothetical protein CIPAW_16G065300 [Carya illinoinensis]KAG6672519.1 hypothetical protein I3842_16G061700 [Carya illinoinensis]KAG7941781.1 hypothetical protein I3843_16G063800 [Carya illinoinensis]
MRPEENPLDLNNLPDDFRDHGKQVFEADSSYSGYRKKKSGGKDGKDDCGKVYECRFCSLKFCKSQALGGHMNRHRQERETETLNRARQLVFSTDNLVSQTPSHLGYCQPIIPGGYHPAAGTAINGDPTLQLRYPRFFSGSPSTQLPPPPPQPPQPPPQPYLYPSPSRPMSFPTPYNPQQHQMNEYCVGHVLGSNNQQCHPNLSYGPDSSTYTCIGAPVGQGFNSQTGGSRMSELLGSAAGGAGSYGRDGSSSYNPEGLNWGRSFAGT